MATATQEPEKKIRSPYEPANIDEHEADKARRAEERAAKRPAIIECITDKNAAKRYEDRKDRYRWEVSAQYMRQDENGKVAQKSAKFTVEAQNEKEAWAKFNDELKVALGPHEGTRSIKRLEKLN